MRFAIITNSTSESAGATTNWIVVHPRSSRRNLAVRSDSELGPDPVHDVEPKGLEHRPDRDERGDAERRVAQELGGGHAVLAVQHAGAEDPRSGVDEETQQANTHGLVLSRCVTELVV